METYSRQHFVCARKMIKLVGLLYHAPLVRSHEKQLIGKKPSVVNYLPKPKNIRILHIIYLSLIIYFYFFLIYIFYNIVIIIELGYVAYTIHHSQNLHTHPYSVKELQLPRVMSETYCMYVMCFLVPYTLFPVPYRGHAVALLSVTMLASWPESHRGRLGALVIHYQCKLVSN